MKPVPKKPPHPGNAERFTQIARAAFGAEALWDWRHVNRAAQRAHLIIVGGMVTGIGPTFRAALQAAGKALRASGVDAPGAEELDEIYQRHTGGSAQPTGQ